MNKVRYALLTLVLSAASALAQESALPLDSSLSLHPKNPLNNPTTLGGWAERLDVQSRALPQEVAFVHMDNACYFQGDTLYYKAYVLRSDNGKPTDLSRVLYTELLDNDGYLIERQILPLKDGVAWGSFCLNDTLYCGYYELRAYTRWQLNWGCYEHDHSERTKWWFFNREAEEEYFRDYEKLYSRVFPLYKKPLSPGDYEQYMPLRPLRRYYKPQRVVETEVAFYPEGGDWIEGRAQRIAFEANSTDGKHLDGTLVVCNAEGDTVAQARTEHRGRGIVTLTGRKDAKLVAEFVSDEGKRNRVELPQLKPEGVVLDVSQRGRDVCLHVEAVGRPATDSLGVTILTNGMLQHFLPVEGSDIVVPLDQLPNGVAQATVYDRQGRVWADRLFFVRHDDLPLQTVAIDNLHDNYAPYERIDLGIRGTRDAVLSLSIRDKATSNATNDNGTLMTELLLSSQIKGFVERPDYYFLSTDSVRLRHLDLLMMTQGWRRHRWHDLTHTFKITQPVEKYRIINGNVYNMYFQPKRLYDPAMTDLAHWDSDEHEDVVMFRHPGSGPIQQGQTQHFLYDPYFSQEDAEQSPDTPLFDESERRHNSELKNEVLVHAEFVQPGSDLVVGEAMTEDGRFTIPLPEAYAPYMMHLAASDSSLWKKKFKKKRKQKWGKRENYLWIVRDNERNVSNLPEFYVRLSFPYPRFVKPYNFYQASETIYEDDMLVERKDSNTIYLNEVTTKARRQRGLRPFDRNSPVLKLDAYDAFNATVDAGLHPSIYYWPVNLRLAIAANYIGEMGVKNRSYTLEPRWNGYNASRFLDSYSVFRYRQLCFLDSVYIYTDYSPRLEGDKSYQQSDQPLVTVDFRLRPNDAERVAFRDRFLYIPGYNVCEDFYHPNYERRLPNEKPQDYRRTLYWNPNLQLDENGEAHVTLYNNGQKTSLGVEAEGVSKDGGLLYLPPQ